MTCALLIDWSVNYIRARFDLVMKNELDILLICVRAHAELVS